MLKRMKINNFRSIVDADLTFGRVNLLIGPNGGGKSNLLEAIGIVSAALGRSVEPIDLDRKGIRLSLPRLFKSTFKNRKIPRGFRITVETDQVEYSARLIAGDDSSSLHFSHEDLKENGQKILGRSPRGQKIHIYRTDIDLLQEIDSPGDSKGIYGAYRSLAHFSPKAVSELNMLESYVIYAPQTAVLRGVAIDPRILEPLGLTGGRLAASVEEVLRYRTSVSTDERERIDAILSVIWNSGWSRRILSGSPRADVVPPQVPTYSEVLYFQDKFMRNKWNWLSAFDVNEGSLYLVFVAVLLAHPKAPRTFALDNVDGTLNPALVQRLVAHIVEIVEQDPDEDRQVFMTSHNPTSLDAIDLFNDDHRAFVVQRNKDTGLTEFLRIKPPDGSTRQDWIELKEGRNTSALWLEGFIDGALNEL